MTRWYCAPSFSRRLLPGLICCALWALGAGPEPPPPTSQPDAPPVLDTTVTRQVKRFDFDERPLGNYEDTPMFWSRMTGEGLPAYSRGSMDDLVGHAAAPSFRFDLQGGNIGYEYTQADLPIFPDSDYLIEGYIQAEGLEYARAFIASYLVDVADQRIPGSECVSRLVRSAAKDKPDWQRVEIMLTGDFPQARSVRLQLWVVQCHVWQDHNEVRIDPIRRQDVRAKVWFDDIVVQRLPRLRFELSDPGGIVLPKSREFVHLAAHNPTGIPLLATVRVTDGDGAVRLSRCIELNPQVTEDQRIPLPDLTPGMHRASVELSADGETLFCRERQFAFLPELSEPSWPGTDLGVDLGTRRLAAPAGVVGLARGLGAGGVKFAVPMLPTGAYDDGDIILRRISDLTQQLRRMQMHTTGVVLFPTSADRPHVFLPTCQVAGTDQDWDRRAGPVFAHFGGDLLSWQVGSEPIELAEPGGWNAELLEHVRDRLRHFVAAPELIVPRSVLDTPPAKLLTNAPDAGELDAAAGGMDATAHAYSFWVPGSLPARAIPWQLAFWFNANSPTRADSTPGPSPRPERWISLEWSREPLPPRDRLADLGRRVVLAKTVNPDRLYVPAPFEPVEEPGADCWRPSWNYIPLRTLFHYLAQAQATLALPLEQDSVAIMFEQHDSHVLVVWSWRPDAVGATTDLYLGTEAAAVDLLGNPRALKREGPRVRVPLEPVPLIIEKVDAPLLLLHASFRIEPPTIEVHNDGVRPVLRMLNYYPSELIGSIDLQAPPTWKVTPNPVMVDLVPGGTLETPLYFTVPPRQVACEQQVGVVLRLKQPVPLELSFSVPVRIELRDIVHRVITWWDGDTLVVEQTLQNQTGAAVSFNAFCQPRGRPRLQGVFLEVPPGGARVQEFRLPNARDLAETQLWVGIEELRGRRTLDQVVPVPP